MLNSGVWGLPRRHPGCVWLILMLAVSALAGEEVVFQDQFRSSLGDGWSWRREHREAWRVTDRGLEVRIEPGNMWGPANDAKNILVRDAPDASTSQIAVSAQIDNTPSGQWEQVDLVWYYDDSNMVKIGHELVDGTLSIVMGREENDKTHTIIIIPYPWSAVQLRQIIHGNRIHGQYRRPGSETWQEAGECDLPEHGPAHISLQCYQGPPGVEHWARITDFEIRRSPTK
jgi:regulation of enolase protein 1 (concanavalin A-like superfamily)